MIITFATEIGLELRNRGGNIFVSMDEFYIDGRKFYDIVAVEANGIPHDIKDNYGNIVKRFYTIKETYIDVYDNQLFTIISEHDITQHSNPHYIYIKCTCLDKDDNKIVSELNFVTYRKVEFYDN